LDSLTWEKTVFHRLKLHNLVHPASRYPLVWVFLSGRGCIPRDINQLAAFIAGQAASDPKSDQPAEPAAVALGRLGGQKDGKARAYKLTSEQKKEIARKAAKARWEKNSAS
jgi:hypothetical protein